MKIAGGSVALIFIVDALRLPELHRHGRARLLHQLLGRLIETDHRQQRIMRTPIDFEHVLHRGDEGRVRMRRNDPLLLAMGLQDVFF
jgi:hypothetical protein